MPLIVRGFRDAAEAAGTSVTGGQTALNPWVIVGGVASVVCQRQEFIVCVGGGMGGRGKQNGEEWNQNGVKWGQNGVEWRQNGVEWRQNGVEWNQNGVEWGQNGVEWRQNGVE